MNILFTLLILVLLLSCGGTTATKKHGNKIPDSSLKSISHTVKDSQACNILDSEWRILRSSYSTAERTIDRFNSITFQSLSVETEDITLYYKSTIERIQNRPDEAMDIKVDYVPKLDGTKDNNKGFIIQASKVFFNSGYYYVKIDSKCYRGKFPSIDTSQKQDIYQTVKLVVN